MDIYLFVLLMTITILTAAIVAVRVVADLKAKQTARIRAEIQRKRLEKELREEEQEDEVGIPSWVSNLAKLYGIDIQRILQGDADALQEALEKFVRR